MDAAAHFRRVRAEGERRDDEDGGEQLGARPAERRGRRGRADHRGDGEGLGGLFVRADGFLIDAVDPPDGVRGGASAEERRRGERAADHGRDEGRRHEIFLSQQRPRRERDRRGDLPEQRCVIQDQMEVGSVHSTTTVIFMLPWPEPQ